MVVVQHRQWEQRYQRKLLATDAAVVIASVFGAQLLRFGTIETELEVPLSGRLGFVANYTVLSLAIVMGWLLVLTLSGSRDPKIYGTASTEYKRVANATLFSFGLFAIISYLARAEIGRGYLLIALPVGLFFLLLTRWLWRKRLHQQRARGKNAYRTLVVGERRKSAHVMKQIMRSSENGFSVVGAATEGGTPKDLADGIQVVADFSGVIQAVDDHAVDTVIMTSTDALSPEQIREIGWQLEARKVDLIVTASLTDIAGPRIHSRPVAGLPLIHIEFPTFSGPKHFMKRMFDLFVSLFLLILLSPVMILVALAVKLTSKGPALYQQQRVGIGGKPFRMYKFRSMVVDADDQLPGLLDQSEGNGILFKMKDDPRITPVGRFIRKYSLDELPQLFNTFKGEMSLVGPRPPLPREVEDYEKWVHRRLLVKPGITGLWQVSGRSDLSWEDSVRLDLYYVENWSLMGDLVLLWRTVRTVTRPEGAY